MQVLSTPQAPVSLPSPTLTNPDMILPDNSPSESSPSTRRQDHRFPFSQSLEHDRNDRSRSASDHKLRAKGTMHSHLQNGVQRHDGSLRLRSSSERGRIRIGSEEYEILDRKGLEVPFASSPTLEEDPGQRIYTESTQGDFENGEGTYRTPAILEEDEDDPHSHAAMTRRAEEILANAKRRLTNMEGNLNRARSTLQTRPSSSMSSYENRSPEPKSLYTIPSKGRSPGGFSPSKHRQANLPKPDEMKQGHLRIYSETSVPSSLQTGFPNGQSTGEGAEVSNGLGVHGADAASRERHSEPSRNWFWNGLTRDTSLKHANRRANGLQPLNEDGPAPSFEKRMIREDDIEEEKSSDPQSPTAATFDAQRPPDTSLSRARSTTQIHELREHMQDLKGKISTLKQKAKEDNLRRRSLQSLRTPSPFTVAEQWYTGAPLPEDILRDESSSERSRDVRRPIIAENPENDAMQGSSDASPVPEKVVEEKNDERKLVKEISIENRHQDIKPTKEVVEGISETVNGFPSEKEPLVLVDDPVIFGSNDNAASNDRSPSVKEALPADFEAKEDSLYGDQDYHETSTSPIIERHEDRPDAFDYEHFILNSALGTYSGIGVRRSSSKKKRANSHSSESSVETTKPRNSATETPEVDGLINGGHCRQNSVDSVSTTNTFATANEGTSSDDQDDWTFGHARAGSRQVEPARKHKAHGSNDSAPNGRPSNGVIANGNKRHITSAQKGYVNGISRKSPPLENGVPTKPPDLLTVLTATGPWQEGAPPTKLHLGDRDKELVERLVKSLAKVCSQMQALGPEGGLYEARVFRRKLDAARRMLDGEMNGEAF